MKPEKVQTNRILSAENAILLIEFVSTTNYKLARLHSGLFISKKAALAFVNSAEYDPEDGGGIEVCFDTQQGEYWDSVEVTYDDGLWHGEDLAMGGVHLKAETIEKMLSALHEKGDVNCKHRPVQMVIKT